MYTQIEPPAELIPYIDAYWCVKTGNDDKCSVKRILPDTCTDIIINLGAEIFSSGTGKTHLESGKAYLSGTMTRYADIKESPGTVILGIRFKPFAMNILLGFSMQGTADKHIELGSGDFKFKKFIAGDKLNIHGLNNFFSQCLQKKKDNLPGVFNSIQESKGSISVQDLARRHHLSERQLERIFSGKTGITVKELCNQVRAIHAIREIKKKKTSDNLLSISVAAGFYDNAHLTKNLKKYTGYTPSSFLK